MLTNNFPIKYYGISSCNYPFPTITEKVIDVPQYINVKNIINVHSTIDLAFNNESSRILDVHYCLCIVNLNIEYIDVSKDDTINIFSYYIYAPLQYFVNNNYPPSSLTPKINNLNLKLLADGSIYTYLAICPY